MANPYPFPILRNDPMVGSTIAHRAGSLLMDYNQLQAGKERSAALSRHEMAAEQVQRAKLLQEAMIERVKNYREQKKMKISAAIDMLGQSSKFLDTMGTDASESQYNKYVDMANQAWQVLGQNVGMNPDQTPRLDKANPEELIEAMSAFNKQYDKFKKKEISFGDLGLFLEDQAKKLSDPFSKRQLRESAAAPMEEAKMLQEKQIDFKQSEIEENLKHKHKMEQIKAGKTEGTSGGSVEHQRKISGLIDGLNEIRKKHNVGKVDIMVLIQLPADDRKEYLEKQSKGVIDRITDPEDKIKYRRLYDKLQSMVAIGAGGLPLIQGTREDAEYFYMKAKGNKEEARKLAIEAGVLLD